MYKLVIFGFISTKFYDEVYILLLNSCVKFNFKKLHALLKYQQKLKGLFFTRPVCVFASFL